jgi:hypothetical protein
MVELYRYAAFISYSSKDAAFARRLHRALESYGIPSSLGKFDLLGAGGKKNRIYPVFRDREELSAGDLGELIEANLKASGALIVVCSPNAAASPWVQKEIEHFIGLGRRERIFAIIADAAPLRDAAGADATPASFPPAFRGNALADPNALEPLAADARRGRDGFRNAWLKIVAGLIGLMPGQIIDRDRRRRRQRTARLVAASALALAGIAAAGLTYATSAWRGELTTAALELASGNYNIDALPLAIAGEGGPAALNPGRIASADEALRKVWAPAATRLLGGPKYFTFSRDGRFVAAGQADGTLEIREMSPPFARRDTTGWGPVANYVFSSNGRFVLADTKAGKLVLHDLDGGAPVDLGMSDDFEMLAVSADGGTVAVSGFDDHALIFRAVNGWTREDAGDIGEIGGIGDDDDYFRLSADGRFLIVSGDMSPTIIHDLGGKGEAVKLGDDAPSWMTADGRKLFVEDDDNVFQLYDLSEGTPHRALAFMADFRKAHSEAYISIEASGDGATVLATAAGTDKPAAAVFDLASGQRIADLPSGKTLYFALSADGRTVLRRLPGDIADIYDVRGGRPVAELGALGRWFSVGLSPDGRAVMATDNRGIGLIAEADHAAPAELKAKKGGALAGAVCAFNGPAVMPIGLEYRDSKAIGASQRRRDVYNAVRGRPWNPCDWRGLGALLPNKARGDGWFEGPRQWLRLLRIRHFGGADYRCEEVNAAGAVSSVRAEACRLAGQRRPGL